MATNEILGRPGTGYIRSLDGLRALAVIIVILSHAEVAGFGGGKTGVLIFFVLSGYLITSILLRELDRTDRLSLKRFYARRFLRLYPALIIVTAATAAIAAVLLTRTANPSAQSTLNALPSVLLYFNNWVPIFAPGTDMGLFSHFWSLAVEEQFYVVWPLLLLAIYKWRRARGVLLVALIGALLSIVFKVFVWDGGGSRQGGTDFASDGLLLGCALAAFLAISTPPKWMGRWLFWVALASLALATTVGYSGSGDPAAYELFGRVFWPVAVLAATAVVFGLATGRAPRVAVRVLELRGMVYLGRISYGMYLWHILVLTAARFVTDSPLLLAAITLVVTIGVASASFYLVERPFLRRKQRYENDPSAANADEAQYGSRTTATQP
ncbi:acyltransferase [Microbacterium sp. cx-59]|uniref:acyltransferase family protein n=1 Tax=Microbacterium sp. cx-59 TaxID=2891207 RepID=UPI001E5E2CEC|nr:acyltransferase [Microbacterium sp. cx-59]MCC4908099.1 acyltransferase [Microbacterium sp. cx-59]